MRNNCILFQREKKNTLSMTHCNQLQIDSHNPSMLDNSLLSIPLMETVELTTKATNEKHENHNENEELTLYSKISSDEKLITTKTNDMSKPDDLNNLIESNTNNEKDSPKSLNYKSKLHTCFYCLKYVTKLPRHLMSYHSQEQLVALFLSKPSGRDRSRIIELIRNKGNYLNNRNFLMYGKGKFIPKKIPSKDECSNTNDFLPCQYCRGFFKKYMLATHYKKCAMKPGTSKESKNLQSKAALLLPTNIKVNDNFKNKVFGIMKVDDVYRAIRNDELITAFGGKLFEKLSSEDHLKTFISQKMRELGRLLIELKSKDPDIISFESALVPSNIQTLLIAIKTVSKFDEEKCTFGIPSLALKLTYSIRKCVSIAVGEAIANEDEKKLKKLELFLKGFDLQIQNLTSQALNTFEKRKWNRPCILPLTEDVRKLNSSIKSEGENLMLEIEDMPSRENLTALSHNLLCSITCFNRKRVGEVQRLTVEVVKKIAIGELSSEILSSLTNTERVLAKKLARLEVRGKRGKKVAILLTEEMVNKIKVLADERNRKILGVLQNNPYLFAVPNSESSTLRGCDALRNYAQNCGAQSPENITSTKLRKHLATMVQLMNLKNNELDVLANFMGHDIRVHREFYRLPEDTIQIAKVSKVLMSLENGNLDAISGRNLDEVEVENHLVADEYDSEIDDDGTEYSNALSVQNDLLASGSSISQIEPRLIELPTSSKSTSLSLDSSGSEDKTVKKQDTSKGNKKKSVKTPWNQEENEAILKYFKKHIDISIVPGKPECDLAKIECPVLNRRPWDQIKSKVYNTITAKKRLGNIK